MLFQESYPRCQDLPGETRIAAESDLSDETSQESIHSISYNDPEACQEVENDFEISSFATIKWCSSIALHLLQLSLNINEKRKTPLNLRKIQSEK